MARSPPLRGGPDRAWLVFFFLFYSILFITLIPKWEGTKMNFVNLPGADAITTLVSACQEHMEAKAGSWAISAPVRAAMNLLSHKIDASDLVAGDHIYSWRSGYTYAHHGIYMGNDFVIHFTRGKNQDYLDRLITSSTTVVIEPCKICNTSDKSEGVLKSCMKCFLAGCPLYRFHYSTNMLTFFAKARGETGTLVPSDLPEKVLHRAKYLLKNGFGCYNVFQNNCEDFAVYCKTGLLAFGRSGQAVTVLGAPLSAILSTPVGLLMANPWGIIVASAGVYSVSRYFADVGARRDVSKVEVEDLIATLK